MLGVSGAETGDFLEVPLLVHRQKEVLDSLKRGEVSDLRISQSYAADKIVAFGLKEGFLQQGLKRFPDPRKHVEVPIEVLLLPQILQRLHDEHSLLLAPYMLNNADLITTLGYNAKVLENGFNDRAKHPRETAFHGETLKHVLGGFRDSSALIDWFNKSWLELWRNASPGRTHQYILDGMKIETLPPKKRSREGSGVVSDNEGNTTHGYKVVWLQEIIDRKGILVALKVVPINVHDIEAARSLVEEFPFEKDALLIVDRAFVDGPWITRLKKEREVDICIPLKKKMAKPALAVASDNGVHCPGEPCPAKKTDIHPLVVLFPTIRLMSMILAGKYPRTHTRADIQTYSDHAHRIQSEQLRAICHQREFQLCFSCVKVYKLQPFQSIVYI